MTRKKIFILLGHPDNRTLCNHLADEYERGAKEAGHEIRRLNLGELNFDPILHDGYDTIQELETDLLKIQENVRWCNHFVIFYPSWWSTMPALLKGMFDRMWLPGFAYHFRHRIGWKKLLKGRSARVFVTSDSHPLLARIMFGDSTNEIKRGILWFSGFSPVNITKVGPVKNITESEVKSWSQKLYRMGRRGK